MRWVTPGPRGPTRADVVDPRLVDVLLGIAVSLAVAVVIAVDLEGTGRAGPPAYLFAVGFGALAPARRRAPRTVVVLTVVGVFAYYILQLPPIGIALPAVVALGSAAEAGRTGWAAGGGGVLTAVAAFFRIEEGLPAAYLGSYEFVTNLALVAAAVALGVSVRERRRSREHQERLRALTMIEQARDAERRITNERMRIARDLHDLIGHTLSVIAVHGHVAAEAIGHDDDTAARAVRQIEASAGESMRELRGIVRLLRSPSAEKADKEERGTVGLAGIERLAAVARDAGLAVDLELAVQPGALDGAIEAAAYRIVQESLTNVVRHAGAALAAVTVRQNGHRVIVEVSDDGSGLNGGRPSAEPGGQGLAGMAERAALLGGSVVARPGDTGGFVVRADLPLRLPG